MSSTRTPWYRRLPRVVGVFLFALVTSLTATNLSATPATAAGNTALQLNGSSQYATLGTASDLRSATFTLELWFQRTGAGVGTSTGTGGVTAIPLITKGRAEAETAAADVNYFFGIDATSGKLVGDFEERCPGGTQPSLNHPVTGNDRRSPATSGTMRPRPTTGRPGTSTSTASSTGPSRSISRPTPLTNALTSVGSARTTAGVAAGFFAGVIDEVRIWSTARSLSQIDATKDTEITAGQAGLLGAWNLNEGTGTSLTDVSGNALTGAAVASPALPAWVAGFVPPPPATPPSSSTAAASTRRWGPRATCAARPSPWSCGSSGRAAGVGTSTGTGGVTAIPLITKGRAEAETAAADVNYFFGIDARSGKLVGDFEEGAGGSSPSLNHPVTGNTVDHQQRLAPCGRDL